jgi:hypothetical protein
MKVFGEEVARRRWAGACVGSVGRRWGERPLACCKSTAARNNSVYWWGQLGGL